jgi:hypothetical protein
VGDAVAQVYQGGQKPVDEHQPVPGTCPDRPPARLIGQACILARLPSRPQLGDQFSQNLSGQPGHPAIGEAAARVRLLDTPRPCSVLHEQAVPLTMHEVVKRELRRVR